jgi:hypothetical protein
MCSTDEVSRNAYRIFVRRPLTERYELKFENILEIYVTF